MVDALIAHKAVRRVNFTGSSRVGKIIAKKCAEYLKPVLLELGGKSPLVVLDDADLDEAVNAAAFGAFANQGQICMSTERIVVDEKMADEFVERFAAKAKSLSVGDPREGKAILGSVIDRSAADRVTSLVLDAVRQGRQAGGRRHRSTARSSTRTCSTSVTPEMRIYEEESFGPVTTVVRVKGDEEAIRIANDTPYGLSAAVFSRDVTRAFAVATPHRHRHLPHQRPHRARRGADAVRRREGLRLRPLRRQGRDQRVHRAALDHHPVRPPALSVLIAAISPGGGAHDRRTARGAALSKRDGLSARARAAHAHPIGMSLVLPSGRWCALLRPTTSRCPRGTGP